MADCGNPEKNCGLSQYNGIGRKDHANFTRRVSLINYQAGFVNNLLVKTNSCPFRLGVSDWRRN
jgi:hypothetical protein